jgi:hypothetical protein
VTLGTDDPASLAIVDVAPGAEYLHDVIADSIRLFEAYLVVCQQTSPVFITSLPSRETRDRT